MQNDPEMELGLWDGNQEVHLQLLRHIRKTAAKIITGEKNFSQPCQGGCRVQPQNIWVSVMVPTFTSHEVLGKSGSMSKFITSKMEKITIFTSRTTLRIEADNDVKDPESKYLLEPNIGFIFEKNGKEV